MRYLKEIINLSSNIVRSPLTTVIGVSLIIASVYSVLALDRKWGDVILVIALGIVISFTKDPKNRDES